jgi:hypothetical protein
VLEIILVLLVLIVGLLVGLATANIAARDVIAGLSEGNVLEGPLDAKEARALRSFRDYYGGGASISHGVTLGVFASIFLVAAIAVRRRLVPKGLSRRRLLLALGVVAGAALLAHFAAASMDEIGRRVAIDRTRLFPEIAVWTNAVELSFVLQVALTTATLSLAVALLTPVRRAVVALGILAGAGYAVVLFAKLPFGPLARPAEVPAAFLEIPGRTVRLSLPGTDTPLVLAAALPDVGLHADPPPLGPTAEKVVAEAIDRFPLADVRGAAARHLHALLPLARFDRTEAALRLDALYAETGSPRLLTLLADFLDAPTPDDQAAGIAVARFGDGTTTRPGDRTVSLCLALVRRNRLAEAASLKERARAEGRSEEELSGCPIDPPAASGAVRGSVTAGGRPAPDVAVALAAQTAADGLLPANLDDPADLAGIAGMTTTRTGSDGRFVFPAVEPGRYHAVVLIEDPRAGPMPDAPRPAAIDVAAGETVDLPAVALGGTPR